jgi:DNA-binding MarR family transcriptional regulator
MTARYACIRVDAAQVGRDHGAHVPALRPVALVPEPAHQLGKGTRLTALGPAFVGALRPPVDTRTLVGEKATEVILSTFRANGLLLAAGDRLAAEHGLTSARWQVLGAIALAQRPLTVPQIARRMGLTRQAVHTTVNRLVADGLVELASNADHRRSQLVSVTELGRARYQAIDETQAAWVNQLAAGLRRSELETTARVLGELCKRLEAGPRQTQDLTGSP